MKLNAIGVTSTNIPKTVEFYALLGFEFPEDYDCNGHVAPTTPPGSARLMIDATKIVKDIIGEDPKAGNISAFALQYDSVEELNKVAARVSEAGFTVFKEPWDAFWGQRYAVVQDPDGFKVDLYAYL